MIRFLAVLLSAGMASAALAQDYEGSSVGNEEVIELHSFTVSSDRDSERTRNLSNGVTSDLYGAMPRPPAQPVPPAVPVSLYRRAESIVVQFYLTNASDRQEIRNRDLYATVEAISAQVAKTPGLRLEQREVRFAGANRKLLSLGKGDTVSHASILIFADLAPGTRIADRVKQVRDALDAVRFVGQTKAQDGTVGLYLKNIDQHRREILQKIFEDLEFVKKGLGTEFEVRPSGLNQRVRSRVASEGELELWIDYSFTIHSVKELQRPKER